VKTARLAAAYCRASPVWLSRPVPATGEKARAARFCPSPLLGALRRLPPTHRPRITLLRLQAAPAERERVQPTRTLILERDGHVCQECGAPAAIVDHITPITGAGQTTRRTSKLCAICNSVKGDR